MKSLSLSLSGLGAGISVILAPKCPACVLAYIGLAGVTVPAAFLNHWKLFVFSLTATLLFFGISVFKRFRTKACVCENASPSDTQQCL